MVLLFVQFELKIAVHAALAMKKMIFDVFKEELASLLRAESHFPAI